MLKIHDDDEKYHVVSDDQPVLIYVKITRQDVKQELDSLRFYFSDSSTEDEIMKMVNQRSELSISDQ